MYQAKILHFIFPFLSFPKSGVVADVLTLFLFFTLNKITSHSPENFVFFDKKIYLSPFHSKCNLGLSIPWQLI
jgi:hypothetical protein